RCPRTHSVHICLFQTRRQTNRQVARRSALLHHSASRGLRRPHRHCASRDTHAACRVLCVGQRSELDSLLSCWRFTHVLFSCLVREVNWIHFCHAGVLPMCFSRVWSEK